MKCKMVHAKWHMAHAKWYMVHAKWYTVHVECGMDNEFARLSTYD